jgi:hypothetical protein
MCQEKLIKNCDSRLKQPDIGADEYIFAQIYLSVAGRNLSDFGQAEWLV